MKLSKELIEVLIEEARKLLEELPEFYQYHDLSHTVRVVNASMEIAEHSAVDDYERDLLRLAAWYHDIGYAISLSNHEMTGAAVLCSILSNYNIEERTILLISDLILSTRINQTPVNELEKILCDADNVHLSYNDYSRFSDSLKKELSLLGNSQPSNEDWNEANIHYFENHQYYTDYARLYFGKGKMRNFEILTKTSSLVNS